MPRTNKLSQFFVNLVTDPVKAISTTAPAIMEQISPEIATAMRVANIMAEKGRGTIFNTDNQFSMGDPRACIKELKEDGYGCPVIVGMQGAGKSTFAVWLARQINNKVNAELGMRDNQVPPDFRRLNSIDDMFALPKGSTIIIDDAGRFLSIYNSYSKKTGQQVVDLVTLCRHYGFVIVIICQNTSSINKHLLDTVQLLFIKQPGMSAGFERPALRKPYQQAINAYRGRNEKWVYSHVYCWSMSGEGLISYQATEVR